MQGFSEALKSRPAPRSEAHDRGGDDVVTANLSSHHTDHRRMKVLRRVQFETDPAETCELIVPYYCNVI